MNDFLTLAIFGWAALLFFIALLVVAVIVKYFVQKRKEDYVERDEWLLDDFYMPRDRP